MVLGGGGGELSVEEAQLRGVGDDVDRLDALAMHGEDQHAGEFAANEAEYRWLAADRVGDQRGTRPPEVQEVAGDAFCAEHHHVSPGRGRPVVDVAPGSGGEHLNQPVEVAVGGGGDELFGDQAVLGRGDVEAGTAVAGGDFPPGPGGELSARLSGPADGLGDGVEGHPEDVVQDEDDALGWGEPLQYDQQRQPHTIVEGDAVGRIGQSGRGNLGGDLEYAGIVG